MIELDYNKPTNKLLIRCNDENIFSELREHFSVKNKNAAFIQRRFGRGNVKISTRKYIITPTGSCDLGLYWEIRKYFITNQITVAVSITDKLTQALSVGIECEFYNKFALELRDYQVDVVKSALKYGWGTCVLGTGAGKTLTTAALIENYFRNCNNKTTFRCLVIVPDLSLVTQTYNEFNLCGISYTTTYWTGSNKPDLLANVTVCNIGILQSQFDSSEWVKYVDLLIIDECIRKDTILSTLKGDTKIQDIRVGDMVLSYNLITKINEYKQVRRVITNTNNQDFIKITSADNKIVTVTVNHKVYTANRGYIRADQLTLNDDIITL